MASWIYVCVLRGEGEEGGRVKRGRKEEGRGERKEERGEQKGKREKKEECSLFPPRHRNASKGLATYSPHKYFLCHLSFLSPHLFFPVQTLSSDAVRWLTLMMPSVNTIVHLLSFFCHLTD